MLPAIKAGAIGYQLKDVEPDILVETIAAATEGKRTLHPQVTNQLMTHVTSETGKSISVLTPRERIILQHITFGQSNKEIAAELHITEKNRKNAYYKHFRENGSAGPDTSSIVCDQK